LDLAFGTCSILFGAAIMDFAQAGHFYLNEAKMLGRAEEIIYRESRECPCNEDAHSA
jgi:hypothetical protein